MGRKHPSAPSGAGGAPSGSGFGSLSPTPFFFPFGESPGLAGGLKGGFAVASSEPETRPEAVQHLRVLQTNKLDNSQQRISWLP